MSTPERYTFRKNDEDAQKRAQQYGGDNEDAQAQKHLSLLAWRAVHFTATPVVFPKITCRVK